MEGNNSATVIYLFCSYRSVLLSLNTAVVPRVIIVIYFRCPVCPACLFVVFCNHVHLDPEIKVRTCSLRREKLLNIL